MNKNKYALILGMSLTAVTHAEVTLSPMVGYHFFDRGDSEYIELDDAPEFSIALGNRITPHIGLELRYGYARPESKYVIPQQSYDYHALTADAYYRFLINERFQPYILAGAGMNSLRGGVGGANGNGGNDLGNQFSNANPMPGQTMGHQADCEYSAIINGQPVTVDNCQSSAFARNRNRRYNHFMTNFGLGAFYDLNQNWALRGEVRGTQDYSRSAFDFLAALGLTYKFAPKDAAPEPIDGDDDQDGVLNSRDKCPGTPINVMVDNDGCPLTTIENLTRRLNVYFDVDKSYVKPIYYTEIEQVADLLRQHPESTVEIQGHTDSTASDAYNMALSERRAQAIANILISQFAINPSRVTWRGYGESQPIADNNTVDGRALNRRSIAATNIKVRVVMTKDGTNMPTTMQNNAPNVVTPQPVSAVQ